MSRQAFKLEKKISVLYLKVENYNEMICISLDLIGWLSINALVRAHNTRIMDLFNFLI